MGASYFHSPDVIREIPLSIPSSPTSVNTWLNSFKPVTSSASRNRADDSLLSGHSCKGDRGRGGTSTYIPSFQHQMARRVIVSHIMRGHRPVQPAHGHHRPKKYTQVLPVGYFHCVLLEGPGMLETWVIHGGLGSGKGSPLPIIQFGGEKCCRKIS